jgi:hypothetical protein
MWINLTRILAGQVLSFPTAQCPAEVSFLYSRIAHCYKHKLKCHPIRPHPVLQPRAQLLEVPDLPPLQWGLQWNCRRVFSSNKLPFSRT